MRSFSVFFGSVLLFLVALSLSSCQPEETSVGNQAGAVAGYISATGSAATPNGTHIAQAPIVLPIAVYIVEDEEGQHASTRDEPEVVAIFQQVNEIWVQASIVIEIQTVHRLVLPNDVVQGITLGDFRPFLSGGEHGFSIPEPSMLNAFFASEIGGPNGIAPFGTDLFFISDRPSVRDHRVTAHEIGHLLGLHHTSGDARRLMFSGTNGTYLTDEEIVTARYIAQGMLNQLR